MSDTIYSTPQTPSPTSNRESLENATGQLFGELWGPYDLQLFEESVELFYRRLKLAGFDLEWFKGKTCLDAGCGGGRNSIAMARLGANEVSGIDLGEKGLADARRRAQGLANARFEQASILAIPFEDEKFDLVWCAGVLMITADEERALDELARVVKPGGHLYLLVYATGGMRWPLVEWLRPLAAQIGQSNIEHAIAVAQLPANKRRTFLDDLFCPRLDFYHWERLRRMLEHRGFRQIERWGTECRLDHEEDLASYRTDLEALASIFAAGMREPTNPLSSLFQFGYQAVQATINTIRWFEEAVQREELPLTTALNLVIGQGHHRVLATKG
jgi:ubiquinone/menaquinone biosynthesis C-methylase UbiE